MTNRKLMSVEEVNASYTEKQLILIGKLTCLRGVGLDEHRCDELVERVINMSPVECEELSKKLDIISDVNFGELA